MTAVCSSNKSSVEGWGLRGPVMAAFLSALFVLGWASTGCAEDSLQITWNHLLPKSSAPIDDPFAKLSEEQLLDLGMIARIRYLMEGDKIASDGPDAKEEKRLVGRLSNQGIDVDWLLSQRERVAELRRKRAEAVDAGVDGKEIKIPGYMLPLQRAEGGVTEFLLVPWVGACIHTPPPPPNQMIHAVVPGGTEDRGRFAPIWLEGRLELKPAAYDLFLVDGNRSVNVAYTMTANVIAEYSSEDSDVLSQVKAPPSNPEHSWWQNLQARISILFTQTMTSIRDRESSGPLWTGLLIAFVYGIVHTLGPGHGKAVVVSYFVGHGGSFGRGVRMGTQIAIFHVLSAIVVVWVTDFAFRQATGGAPSDYRIVKLISYAGIAFLGAAMLWRAIRGARHNFHHSDNDHEGYHHSEGNIHSGCHACETVAKKKGPAGWLALAIGSVPCTGALLVLLFGMANDLLAPAVLMVVAISGGMAVAMSGIGVLAIVGRNLVDRKIGKDRARQRRFADGARITGAAAVLLIGLGLFGATWTVEARNVPTESVPSSESGVAKRQSDKW